MDTTPTSPKVTAGGLGSGVAALLSAWLLQHWAWYAGLDAFVQGIVVAAIAAGVGSALAWWKNDPLRLSYDAWADHAGNPLPNTDEAIGWAEGYVGDHVRIDPPDA